MPRYPSDEFMLGYVATHNQKDLMRLLTAKDKRVIKYAVRGVVQEMPGYELRNFLLTWRSLANHQEDD